MVGGKNTSTKRTLISVCFLDSSAACVSFIFIFLQNVQETQLPNASNMSVYVLYMHFQMKATQQTSNERKIHLDL